MRISDWSSDVCSSDLIWSRLSRPAATIAQVLSLAAIIAVLLSPLHDVYIIPAFALLVAATAADRGLLARIFDARPQQMLGHTSYSLYLLNFPEIGRASCWERVCQYV